MILCVDSDEGGPLMQLTRPALLSLMLASALALSACGDSDDETSGSGTGGEAAQTTQTTQSTETSGGGASGGTVEIAMENVAFNPDRVTVKVGQKITWTN